MEIPHNPLSLESLPQEEREKILAKEAEARKTIKQEDLSIDPINVDGVDVVVKPVRHDLNKLRNDLLAGNVAKPESNKRGNSYEDLLKMTHEELQKIADDNNTTPEELLKGAKQLDTLRKLAAKDDAKMS